MGATTLPEGATISDVLRKLDKPEGYLIGVLQNMYSFEAEHGASVVRIGTTGRGSAPHYRIEPKVGDTMETFAEDMALFAKDLDAFFVAFHGKSHKKLDWGMLQLRGDSWSSAGISFEQVQNLLGEVRGKRRI